MIAPPEQPTGRLAENIVYFARALRAAGIPVGPGAVLDALEAVKAAGVGTREDFYWTLHAVFVKRHEHSIIFDQAFRIFFRRRGYVDQLMAMMLPQAPNAPRPPEAGATRVHDALFSAMEDKLKKEQEIELDTRMTVSDREVLQKKDFAQMTAAEIAAAKEAMKRLVLPLAEVRTRRLAPHPHGHVLDMRRTLRASMKGGGGFIDLRFIGPKTKPPPLVALLDISGSMSQYSRVFLHFLHALTDARKRVNTFLFGTRLSNVTRALRERDPDDALAACSASVPGLVGRHPHRVVAARLQQIVGAPRARPGRHRAPDHRRARPRRRRHARFRHGPPAPLLPAARLAQSAAALRRFRGPRPRHQDHAAACRRIPPDPQSGFDRRAGRLAAGGRRPGRGPESLDAKGRLIAYIWSNTARSNGEQRMGSGETGSSQSAQNQARLFASRA